MNVQLVAQDTSSRLPAEGVGQTEAAGTAAPVVLPPIREASRWDAATDALLAALEAEEASALAQLEAARERARAARRAAGALRQVRQAIRTETRPDRPLPTSRATGARGEKRWARDHDACRICGRTDQPHYGHGRCAACAQHFRTKGVERSESLWRRTES